MIKFKQYDIVIVNLDPTIGSEINKTRPAIIASPDEMNKPLMTVTICPVTSKSRKYPTRIDFDLEGNLNWIVVDQIRTIDKKRIIKNIGELQQKTIDEVKQVIKETFVD